MSYYIPEKEQKGNGDTLATVSMILGIISAASVLLCCCCGQFYITAALGIAAVICGILARSKGTSKKGKWLAGIICGAVGVGVTLVLIIFDILNAVTGGMLVINMLAPLYESMGIDINELMALIESGATEEEIMEWLEDQMNNADGIYYGAKAMIQAVPAKISGLFSK